MKRLLITSLFSIISVLCFAQETSETVCHLGFTYDISKCPQWGYNKPVITSVTPYTSAEQAGIKAGDILEAVEGVKTLGLTAETLSQLLNPANKEKIVITVKDFALPKNILLRPMCKNRNAITEDQLAAAFSFYSLETTFSRVFTCPFKTNVTHDAVDFSSYQTFAFSELDINNRELETTIYGLIQANLETKGMRASVDAPDIVIQTYYFFNKNPNYKGVNRVVIDKETTYRYNSLTHQMEAFPFLPLSTSEVESEYLLQLGIRFVDQKIKPGRILWECEANEFLEKPYELVNYAQVHVPLMLEQFPQVKHKENVRFMLKQQMYNYTGIGFDIDNLNRIVQVDPNSPAWLAGIRKGQTVKQINNHSISRSADEYTQAYRNFISATMKYRDAHTRFTDTNGFTQCMYWDESDYSKVASALKSKKYKAPFSYLFAYAPYVNPSANNLCIFIVEKNGVNTVLNLRPTLRTSVSLTVQ